MSVWLVRCGKRGESGEHLALSQSIVGVGWGELGDLSTADRIDEIRSRLSVTFRGKKQTTLSNWATQLNAFVNRMQFGDLVVVPLKSEPAVAIGKVAGPYRFMQSAPSLLVHQRAVIWQNPAYPRSSIGHDLLASLGSIQTVCEIKRNYAEYRLNAVISDGEDPAFGRFPSRRSFY